MTHPSIFWAWLWEWWWSFTRPCRLKKCSCLKDAHLVYSIITSSFKNLDCSFIYSKTALSFTILISSLAMCRLSRIASYGFKTLTVLLVQFFSCYSVSGELNRCSWLCFATVAIMLECAIETMLLRLPTSLYRILIGWFYPSDVRESLLHSQISFKS